MSDLRDPEAIDRGEMLLNAIYEDVDQRLNPNGEECWHCGGEGETFDCFDGFCRDADFGCPDCTTACPECRINSAERAKAIREEVIKSEDIDIARAWLKSVGRLSEGISADQILRELKTAKAKLEGVVGDHEGFPG
nr:hypothetical protein DBT41_10090 [Aerococcus urinae]